MIFFELKAAALAGVHYGRDVDRVFEPTQFRLCRINASFLLPGLAQVALGLDCQIMLHSKSCYLCLSERRRWSDLELARLRPGDAFAKTYFRRDQSAALFVVEFGVVGQMGEWLLNLGRLFKSHVFCCCSLCVLFFRVAPGVVKLFG